MKIYKFRRLTSEIDFCRLREIIETGNFRCSSFWDLNDPMEGVFSILDCFDVINKINEVYGEKGQYKICSFSGEEGFKNPTMWGYYSNGFKGAAIEVEIENNEVKKVDYINNGILFNKNNDLEIEVKKILLNKNMAWSHEDEYRFLDKLKDNSKIIGNITAIYFGTPYDNLENSEQIQKDRKSFIEYKIFKEKLIKIAKEKTIKYFDVKVENGVVEKVDKNL